MWDSLSGVLTTVPYPVWLSIDIALILVAGFVGLPVCWWTLVAAFCLLHLGTGQTSWIIFAVVAAIANVRPLRRYIVSLPILRLMRWLQVAIKMSQTERTALEAGDVWIEANLFSGKPDFCKLQHESYPALTSEEQAFLDGPVEEICRAANDWHIWQERDLPEEVWRLLKKHRVFGMIIPKEYGGLGFSALAHSEVVMKLSSHSIPLAIVAMVPNALGPAELLIHYGTKEQKEYYLPRLASGEEIPCFALTEPKAGSDAGAMAAEGSVFLGSDNKPWLRLNWHKRYITLAPVATVVGLAFRMRDPQNILGKGEELGITCALIPALTKGVQLGMRHDPLGVPFPNGPTYGENVELPLNCVVGGMAGVGRGWQMLMECLASGRGISLPAQVVGMGKCVVRETSAYATVRKQFGVAIGKFEGIVEPLVRITGIIYLLEAARKYTLGALDKGIKPPVVTAIIKHYSTELSRRAMGDAMDIFGGAAIVCGPRNLLAHAYFSAPIGLTVEGANILTRTMIIFGQGVMRAHPFAYRELTAITDNDLGQFDNYFWQHVGHVVRNAFRCVLLSISRGRFAMVPGDRHSRRYYRKLAWSSASFALLADIAMTSLGGRLKFAEKLAGRFADILAWMYLGTAVLRRYEAEGQKKEDLPMLHWAMQFAFAQMQSAFEPIYQNLPLPMFGFLLHGPVHWWARLNSFGSMPDDRLDREIARLIQTAGEQRDRYTTNIYGGSPDSALAKLEQTFVLACSARAIEQRVEKAVKNRTLEKMSPDKLIAQALAKGVISEAEASSMSLLEEMRNQVVAVDSFSPAEYKHQV
jgi:acyl-CoA dehydrogenase